MLPWVFAILVLLNAGLFIWGYQREKSLEPLPVPVPEGSYEIRLLGEPQKEPTAVADSDDADAQIQSAANEASEGTRAPTSHDGSIGGEMNVPAQDASAGEKAERGDKESDLATRPTESRDPRPD